MYITSVNLMAALQFDCSTGVASLAFERQCRCEDDRE